MTGIAVAQFPLSAAVTDAPLVRSFRFWADPHACVPQDFSGQGADLHLVRRDSPPATSLILTSAADQLTLDTQNVWTIRAPLASMQSLTPGIYACELRALDDDGDVLQTLLIFDLPVAPGLSGSSPTPASLGSLAGDGAGTLDVVTQPTGAYDVLGTGPGPSGGRGQASATLATIFLPSMPAAGATIYGAFIRGALPVSAAGSGGWSVQPATAETVIPILVAGVQQGTVTFAEGEQLGVAAWSIDAITDQQLLTFTAPSPADLTLGQGGLFLTIGAIPSD